MQTQDDIPPWKEHGVPPFETIKERLNTYHDKPFQDYQGCIASVECKHDSPSSFHRCGRRIEDFNIHVSRQALQEFERLLTLGSLEHFIDTLSCQMHHSAAHLDIYRDNVKAVWGHWFPSCMPCSLCAVGRYETWDENVSGYYEDERVEQEIRQGVGDAWWPVIDGEEISSYEVKRIEVWQWVIMHAAKWDAWVLKVVMSVGEMQSDTWVILLCGSILLGLLMAFFWGDAPVLLTLYLVKYF